MGLHVFCKQIIQDQILKFLCLEQTHIFSVWGRRGAFLNMLSLFIVTKHVTLLLTAECSS